MQRALQHVNARVQFRRDCINVLAIDRRDERQVELFEYAFVDFVRFVLEPEYLVDPHQRLIRILDHLVEQHRSALKILRVLHEQIKELRILPR